MPSVGQRRLTGIVKRLLDAAWFILVGAAILWPIVVLGVGSNFLSGAETRYVDIFLGFKIYPDVVPEVATASAVDAVIRGMSKVQINTPSLFAWYLAAAISQVGIFIALYGLAQMRALFATLLSGWSFTRENAGRIKKLGFVLIGWHVIMPLLQYFGGRAMLSDMQLDIQGVQLYPAFESNITGIFVGLAVIVLSGILREAATIHQEQSLTI